MSEHCRDCQQKRSINREPGYVPCPGVDPVDVAGWLHGIADKERGKKSRMLRSLIRSLADAYEREFGKRGEPVNGPGQPSHEALVELLEAARRNHLCHKQDEIRLCNYWSCKVLARCETEAKGER